MPSRYSLHIGISQYNGTNEPKDLTNSVNDANINYSYCKHIEFFDKSIILTNSQVDLGVLVNYFYYFSQICRKGDLFVFTYAGHGVAVTGDSEFTDLKRGWESKLTKAHGEERTVAYNKKFRKWLLTSAADNAWLINNNDYFYDNLLTLLIKCFEPGVRILAINDSCQNASMIDTHNLSMSENAFKTLRSNVLASNWAKQSKANETKIYNIFEKLKITNEQKIKQGVIVMSSVWEFDLANDSGINNKNNGLYTGKFFEKILFSKNYYDLHQKIHDEIKSEYTNYFNSINLFVDKFYLSHYKKLTEENRKKLTTPNSFTNEQFYKLVEGFLDKADVAKELPPSLTGNDRYSKIEKMFEYKWKHYVMKTINLLSPWLNTDLADEFTPGFSSLKPFKL